MKNSNQSTRTNSAGRTFLKVVCIIIGLFFVIIGAALFQTSLIVAVVFIALGIIIAAAPFRSPCRNKKAPESTPQTHKIHLDDNTPLINPDNASTSKPEPSYYSQKESIAVDVEALEKKAKTAENRVANAQRLYDSMTYFMRYFDQLSTDELQKRALPNDAQALESYRPDLKCMSVKELKARFRKIESDIKTLTEASKSQYTTKANATIYQLMTLALDAELTNILHDLSYGKLEDGIDRVKAMTAKYYLIAQEGNQTIAPTLKKFIGRLEYLYIEAVKTEYEYHAQQERIRQEQRELREKMRQEAAERKILEQERKKIEAEEHKYVQEMDRIKQEMQAASDGEMEKMRARLAELEGQLNSVNTKKAEIVRLQNGKAGTVYIISNVGSFGDNVFKVGMTRRSEPQDRVDELGDASVPFPFDVHSFIFSEDAAALENELHRRLNSRRVNRVNLRKEFFNVPISELRDIVQEIDPTASFTETALAEQYHQSLSMGDDVVMATLPEDADDYEDEPA